MLDSVMTFGQSEEYGAKKSATRTPCWNPEKVVAKWAAMAGAYFLFEMLCLRIFGLVL